MYTRGFHVYKSSEWKDIKIGGHVTIERETSQEPLKVYRYCCAVKRTKADGVVAPIKLTVGHVPLEVSRFCHYFLANGGTICWIDDDTRPRRSLIPSGGLEIKLKLKFQVPAKFADKMRVLIRNAYDYNFDEVNADDDDADEENEDYEF